LPRPALIAATVVRAKSVVRLQMAAVAASLWHIAKGGRVSRRDHAADPGRLINARRALLAAAGRGPLPNSGVRARRVRAA